MSAKLDDFRIYREGSNNRILLTTLPHMNKFPQVGAAIGAQIKSTF